MSLLQSILKQNSWNIIPGGSSRLLLASYGNCSTAKHVHSPQSLKVLTGTQAAAVLAGIVTAEHASAARMLGQQLDSLAEAAANLAAACKGSTSSAAQVEEVFFKPIELLGV